jgi:hypothetical protein
MCLRLRDVAGIRIKLGEGMRHLGGWVMSVWIRGRPRPLHRPPSRPTCRRGPLQQFRFADIIAFNCFAVVYRSPALEPIPVPLVLYWRLA